VNFVLNKLLGFTEELTSKDGHSGSSVTDFLVLSLGDVDENSCCGVVNVD
jgi:hypothetical protein